METKKVGLGFGKGRVAVELPVTADVVSSSKMPELENVAQAVDAALASPLGTLSLAEVAKGKKSAAIVVSDNTRPVPYKGEGNILSPVLKILKDAGIADIKVIVATGTHRAMEEDELRAMLASEAFEDGVRVLNHDCVDESQLRLIGSTSRTPDVVINSHYLDAELKILTGLVEPHFMAGFSGGRKAVCPGISGESVTFGFHSAQILSHEKSTSLIMEGNPCHEEALEIAKMAGANFLLNVTINDEKKVGGVFAGDLEEAHFAAIDELRKYSVASINKKYDLILMPALHVGVNHYQCAKPAIEASKAVKAGGDIIIIADMRDPDPVGSEQYKKSLAGFAERSAEDFWDLILSDKWEFIPEQWQVQLYAKVVKYLGGKEHLQFCVPQLLGMSDHDLAGKNLANLCEKGGTADNCQFAQKILQNAVDKIVAANPEVEILALPDGPYAVPVIE